jgi:hypothetical protein
MDLLQGIFHGQRVKAKCFTQDGLASLGRLIHQVDPQQALFVFQRSGGLVRTQIGPETSILRTVK